MMESLPYTADFLATEPSMHEIFAIALEERQRLERAWSHETAHHSVVHQDGEPISRGQCGVSSVWLTRQLLERGYQARVAEGTIETDDLHEGFVWVQVERSHTEPLVVDITSDQFGSLHGNRVHVGQYSSGPGTIGSYVLSELFDPYANTHRKLMRRYALLEQNVRATHSPLVGRIGRILGLKV
ncbi:MAG TPA: hypothetical protein VLH38_05955 [Patescibacteria group bacterium]|nr:hypothetical protein [Patescibacteria group bacterium]